MPTMAMGRQFARRAERWLGFCCALVFLLIVTHVFLMASERHAAVMGPQMDAAPMGAIARLMPQIMAHAGHEDSQPTSPHHTVLGDCPAQQAVPPLFLLLLLLIALLRRLLPPPQFARLSWAWLSSLSLPPPLDPARRRALLQVFLN
jgi:hypothetical protein